MSQAIEDEKRLLLVVYALLVLCIYITVAILAATVCAGIVWIVWITSQDWTLASLTFTIVMFGIGVYQFKNWPDK